MNVLDEILANLEELNRRMAHLERIATGTPSALPKMVTLKQVAEFLAIPVATLARAEWRERQRFPQARKSGRRLVWSEQDIKDWFEHRQRRG